MREPQRVSLANLPTPLIRLERLGRELGGAQPWMKRDDLTGLEISGNKVRKLEFVVADALAGGCDTLVTEGTPQSNHCRATAATCARLGLRCLLLFRPEAVPVPQGNHLLDVLFGADTRSYTRPDYAARREAIIAEAIADLRAQGHTPRWTPAGASETLGCWGYIHAAAELDRQLRAAGIAGCDVVTATSSGGTYAGTLLGTLLHGLDYWRLWAVPVSEDVAHHTAKTEALCRAAIEQFDLSVDFDPAAMQFLDGYVGAGYAVPYARAIEGLRLLARTEGIMLEPVYTAKAFCAVLDGVRNRRFGFDRPVVFLHTGGIFSDFAWPETLLGPDSQQGPST